MFNPSSLLSLSCTTIYETILHKREQAERDIFCTFPTNYLKCLIQNSNISTELDFLDLLNVDQIIQELILQRNFEENVPSNNLDILCLKQIVQKCAYLKTKQLEIYFQNTPWQILLIIRSNFPGDVWFRILGRIIRTKEPNFYRL